MPKILDVNINTSENYDRAYGVEQYKVDITQPERAKALLKGLKKKDQYLDIGCGMSPNFLMAYALTDKVWASDFAPTFIEKRQAIFANSGIRFILDDIRDTKLPKEFFDYISAGELLEHFEDPYEEVKKIVELLKKGGTLAVSVPNDDKGEYAPEHHIWSFTEEELEKMLNKYGKVKIEKLRETEHNYLIGYLTKK